MRDDTPTATRKLFTLRQFPGLAGSELGELAMIADNAIETTFAAGAVVAAPPGRLPAIHMVVDGRIAANGPNGTIATWGPRTVFGILEVVAGRAVETPAVAVSPTRTLRLAAAEFAEVLEDNYNLLSNVRRVIAGRLLALGEACRRIDVGHGRTTGATPGPGPLGMVERLILLRPQIPFALGKIQALAAIAEASEEVRWPAGATISRAGDSADGAIVIVEGSAIATRPDLEPQVLGPGNAVGRLETLAEQRHTLTVDAIAPVRALRCAGRTVFDVMEDHTDLALAMIATLAGELLDAARRADIAVGHWGPS